MYADLDNPIFYEADDYYDRDVGTRDMTLEADGCITIYSVQSGEIVAQYEGLEVHKAMSETKLLRELIKEWVSRSRVMDDCPSCGNYTEWWRVSTGDGSENYCTSCGYSSSDDIEDIPF